jgi:Uma2 family endonuclease
MPAALLEPLESPPRKRWTREECEKLEAMGWFAGQKFELIDGDLINTMGKNSPHVVGMLLMHEWLVSVFGFRRVQQEAPTDVAPQDNRLNEPEPDLVVLRTSRTAFTKNPQPEDVLLVVEVSDTTLEFDLTKKAQLYARAGIPDYWVLDVNKRRLIVHREPLGGGYTAVLSYRTNERVSPLAAPQSPFLVSAAFEE